DEHERDGRGLDRVHVLRERQEVARLDRDEFAVEAVGVLAADRVVGREVVAPGLVLGGIAGAVARLDHDLVADAEPRHALAERHDLARAVAAEDARELDHEARHAAPHPEVEVVERDAEHADERLAGAGRGSGHVLDAEDGGFAVLMDADCLHGLCSLRCLPPVHRPLNWAWRFWTKAAMPSRASSEAKSFAWSSRSSARPTSSGTSAP